MLVYHNLEAISKKPENPYVTIGNFDGVHLGHQMLFSEVVNKAYRNQGTSIAITFDPHPLQVVRPEIGIKLISTFEQKVELIQLADIDILIVLPFTSELAATPAAEFIDRLQSTIGITELIVGYDYAFGKGRQGDIPFLKAHGEKEGFAVSVVEAYYVDEMLASSTKIRALVTEGRMRDVKKLLGRYYQIRGEVKVGKQRGGSLIGFPTANLQIAPEDLCPRHGVYVTQVIYGGKCYGGVLNIGRNPTFADHDHNPAVSAETHIFDFNQDIYGQPIKVNLLRFLRDEKKFSGPAELSRQIATDIEEAKRVLDDARKEVLLSCEDRFNY
ncbi:MAG: bifunctional riboflavin kinase/FAD synthetase [Proteobacteria bacterium]|nr:bifunctional riboflavin kinase/FAD synthetase [Pseudomonadota bacterium]MBU1739101.1 bifunctional riboflavin kinase/FAD synthetase [Pseudomonadota bacterium]